tara:strand:+ start:349 stop:768 length:420 start_codon:yes stop_codon:yes gene_type:complete
MIKYKLKCNDCKEVFDSWFSSSKEFEKIKKIKLLSCHKCNSLNVDKSLMAPNVINKSPNERNNKKFKEIKSKLKEYQKFIKNNFEYVGDNFTYEARSIHYNKKKNKKAIYGNASKEDIKDLREEGIETELVPWIEDKEN